ncbi:MAG: response regulator [Proteobacteria bacterium]|nr:response regulator [Pseudomonadota bacterium]
MKKNILLIDDNRDSLETTEEIIHTYMDNVNVFTALSGKEGIALALRHKMDVIMLDLDMPKMNGIEVCQRMREMQETQYTPIIFFTGMDTDSSIRSEALAVGGDEFISKPIQVSELIARINVMLRIKRMRDKIEEEKKTAETNLDYMKMLWEFSSETLKITKLHELADKITQSGVNLTGASGGFINIYDNIDSNFENVSLFIKNHDKEYVSSFEELKFVGFTGISSIIVDDIETYCNKNNIKKGLLPFGNMMIIPLISKKFIFGVLVLFDKKSGFKENDMMKMETFSNFASGILFSIYSSQKHMSLYEKRYESLFNLIDVPLFIMDRDGEFIDMNDSFAKIFGKKNKYELNVKNFYNLITDKSDAAFIKKGIAVKESIRGFKVKFKGDGENSIDVVINMEREKLVGSEQYYLKGSIINFSDVEESEKETRFFRRISELYTLTDREFYRAKNEKTIYQNCAYILRKTFGFKSVIIALFDDTFESYKAIGSSFAGKKYADYVVEKDVLEKIKKGDKNIYKFQQFDDSENIIIPLKSRKNGEISGFVSIVYNGDIKNRGSVFEAIITFGNRLMTEINRLNMRNDIDFYVSLIDSLIERDNSPILVIDSYYKIRLHNSAFIKMRNDTDINGKYCYEIIHGTDKPVDFCPLSLPSVRAKSGTIQHETYFEPLLNKNIYETIIHIKGEKGVLGYILKFGQK